MINDNASKKWLATEPEILETRHASATSSISNGGYNSDYTKIVNTAGIDPLVVEHCTRKVRNQFVSLKVTLNN